LCPAQLPGALDSVAANGLIGINSNVMQSGRIELCEKGTVAKKGG
jgi:hypothetical protein